MSEEQSCLEGRGLTHSFGQGAARTTVVREVSVRLRRAELVLIMGPSGSGKSTLLALLSGLMQPVAGQVLALGEDVWRLSAAARKQFRLCHFGFIFQGYNLFPALSARQQLEIVLRWGQGVSARAAVERADKMLQLLDLGGKKGGLRPAQMSGGEKQRVAIGRALVKEPKFLFADEPTSALDWEHGKHVVELLRAAATRGACVFVVAHDSRLVPYADRVLHIEDGRLSETERAADPARSMAS
jgi:putative ABC transport system ATP-binding protein